MEARKKTALVVAQPGKVRDGIQVLLTAIPQLESVMVVDDGSTALLLVMKHLPTVVLVDYDCCPAGAMNLLSRIKTNWPQIHCLVLTDKIPAPKALSSRADRVLRKGMSAANLLGAIDQFIVSSG